MSFLKKKEIFSYLNSYRSYILSRQLRKSILAVFFCLAIAATSLFTFSAPALAAAATTSITITKYASDETTVISQKTISYQTMQSTLPVQGDGTTHYFMQGPNLQAQPQDTTALWDPSETINLKDKGAVKGTDLKDLCNLVGGMASGDTVQIEGSDGFSKTFNYPNVYTPTAEQGKMVVCWYTMASENGYPTGAYVPAYLEGLQLVFLAQTTNTTGQHVFGNEAMKDCFPQSQWYYFEGLYPSSDNYSVKWISQINIYSTITPYWDLNGDHICNIGDVVVVGLHWGQTGADGWIPEDLNDDGVINIGDVVKLGLHWGQTW